MSDANLRPVTLPSLSPTLTRLAQLKSEVANLHSQVDRFQKLAIKLETFTDEPTWDAYIPFGPLAFFPGQLVHTNDITQTVSPSTASGKAKDESETAAKTEPLPSVLRSAKQARLEADRLRTETLARIDTLKAEILKVEADLKQERTHERQAGQGNREGAALGLGDDEDWTVNERGEVINEDGLPIFDIREDLPEEPEQTNVAAESKTNSAQAPVKQQMRYLVKKGNKQIVRPLKSTSPAPAALAPVTPTTTTTVKPQEKAKTDPAPVFPSGDAPKLDIRAILDELEAEEEIERTKAEALDREEQAKLIRADEAKGEAAQQVEQPAKGAAFGGFSAGFLSKSKQKRPSNSLVSSSKSESSSTPAVQSTAIPSSPLKSSLSRSTSRAASPAPGGKKQVAFDLPVPDDQVPTREGAPKKQPIILGLGPTPADAPAEPAANATPKPQENFVRPIKDLVVEKPLKKPVPPGTSLATGEKPKRVSRFRQMKDQMVETEKAEQPQGKGKGRAVDSPPSILESAAPPTVAPANDSIPAPIHTISLSSKPSASSSTSGPKNPDGTVSYADIPFESDEEDPHLSGEDPEDEDDEDWYPSEDEEEFDEGDFDVDSALHQREVALEYHRQRLGLAAGRGTGPLGGYHNDEESPFADVVAEQGVVPSDATLDSLTSSLSHAAALGKPSRFRTANKHLESASLIIPSVLASDPSLTKSHTMLGPAPSNSQTGTREDLAAEDEDRMRRTLEALVEGRPLPQDEQLKEREKEIALREEYAKRIDSERRMAGKAPPTIQEVGGTSTTRARPAIPIEVPQNPLKGEVVEKRVQEPSVIERPAAPAVPTVTVDPNEDKPKKMSRFRQKQLGLID
ncbi:uncharacterized protein JCM15063_001216 [Sporobolomyces koalae]|uniref:uncharacterized protein n=1 Tax=Sporobolomyces koalae TaxID=500713 RepID=UPI00316D2AEC